MGFGRYSNKNQADLVYRLDLFYPGTSEPALLPDGRQQYLTFRGEKSRAYQNAVENEVAREKRAGKDGGDFSFEKNSKAVARRLSLLVVSALIDAGDSEPDIIEISNISDLKDSDRNEAKARLYDLFLSVSDLALDVHKEVTTRENFLPGRGIPLSSLSSNSNTMQQPQKEATTREYTE